MSVESQNAIEHFANELDRLAEVLRQTSIKLLEVTKDINTAYKQYADFTTNLVEEVDPVDPTQTKLDFVCTYCKIAKNEGSHYCPYCKRALS